MDDDATFAPSDEDLPAEPPADETPADDMAADEAPADETPADDVAADEAPTDEAPADDVAADEAPADSMPASEISELDIPAVDVDEEPPAESDTPPSAEASEPDAEEDEAYASLERRGDRRNGTSVWVWVAAIVAALAVIGAGVYLFWPAKVIVPDVVGMTPAEAVRALKAAGLELGETGSVGTTVVVVGLIGEQSPEAGVEVVEGTAIDLLVASDTALMAVPDVVGMTKEEAQRALAEAGFKMLSIKNASDQTEGTVFVQEPPPGGPATTGSEVIVGISISAAAANVQVPDVAGKTQAAAEQALTAAGLNAQTWLGYSEDVPSGAIIGQLPDKGASVARGTVVGLLVSQGEPPRRTGVTTPDVKGKSRADAIKTLDGRGLEPVAMEVYDDAVAAGLVVAQLPAGGAEVAKGTQVGIAVSKGPAPTGGIAVPDLVGKAGAAAVSEVGTLGLVPHMVEVPDDAAPAGKVFRQLPAAGSSVSPGATVAILVSKGPE